MRTHAIRIGVVLILGVGGLEVSQALSLERWVDEAVLAQETRGETGAAVRFGRVVPAGWSPGWSEPGRPGQALLTA